MKPIIIRIRLERESTSPADPDGCKGPAEPGLEFDGFEGCLLGTKRPWWSVVASAALHGAAIVLIPMMAAYVPARDEEKIRLRVVSIQPLQIRIPEQLLLASERPRISAPGKTAPRREGRRGGGSKAYRNFELPELAKHPKSEQTILQPEAAPQLAASRQALPQMMFWAAQLPAAPRPEPKKFIMPGRRTPRTDAPQLNAPPLLAVPSAVALASGLAAANPAIAQVNPKLPLPAGTSMPVRAFTPPSPKPPSETTIDLLPGEPLNVIALNPNPAAMKPLVVVPAGSQIGDVPPFSATGKDQGRLLSRGGAGEEGSGKGEGSDGTGAGAAGRGSNGLGAGTDGPGRGPGSGAATGNGSGGSVGTGSGGGNALSSRAATEGGAGGAGTGYRTSGLRASDVPIRIVNPENGNFDVVVQAASLPDVAEGPGMLSGRPVYTVYMNVGIAKEWIVQYCVPNSSDGVRQSGNVIQLGNPAPVKPPFPLLMTVPPAVALRSSKRTVMYGFITSTGQFRGLQAVRSEDEESAFRLVPFLKSWQFRPATRDGRPIEVELLLIVPPTGG